MAARRLPAFLTSPSDEDAAAWRRDAVSRFVELDLPQFGVNVAAPTMLRFWAMLAHMHGQVWNAADPARSLGVSDTTVRRYLDFLTQGFMVRQLQPWYQNLGKRQVKAPKIYFRDSGLLHALLGVESFPELLRHPRSGASWEGFALEQVLRLAQPNEAYFRATHGGAELDLLMFRYGKRIGVEFKRADAPGSDAVHAHRARRPRLGRALRRLPRRQALSAGGGHRSGSTRRVRLRGRRLLAALGLAIIALIQCNN